MVLPDITETITDGGLGAASAVATNVQVVIGVSSSGTTAQPTLIATPTDLVSTFGYGPAVEAAAMGLFVGRAPILFVRSAVTTASTVSSVTHSGTGTSVMSVTGTAKDTYDAIVKVTVAGTIDTAPYPQIQVSLDGGTTYSANIRVVGTAPASVATFATETGLTLMFAAGTLVAGETYTFTATEAKWDTDDVHEAILSLGSAADDFSFTQLVGKMSETEAATIDDYVDTLSETQFKIGRAHV